MISNTYLRGCKMSLNPDIAAHYHRQKDRKRLMALARAWVRRGGGPIMFVNSLNKLWPTGLDRLGKDRALDAWYLAKDGCVRFYQKELASRIGSR
jgi:hypothetical protein